MKRGLKIVGLLLLLTLSIGALSACITPTVAVSAEQARQIAIDSVGVDVNLASFTATETEVRNNTQYYDVEFLVKGVKYEYEVNAENGNVVKIEINDQPVSVTEAPVSPAKAENDYVGVEAAKTAALLDAGVAATDAVFSEEQLDFDNGKYMYELEFTAGGKEYEYDVLAEDGTIYKKEIDHVTVVTPPTVTGDGAVTVETAKATALLDAGLTEAEVTLSKAMLERDNGVYVYEIEFFTADKEYEYEINATTGSIIKKDIEQENTPPVTGEYVGVEAAKTIAIQHAGLTVEAVVIEEAQLEVKRGTYVYEIDFTAAGYEYEYCINAATGEVMSVDKERD